MIPTFEAYQSLKDVIAKDIKEVLKVIDLNELLVRMISKNNQIRSQIIQDIEKCDHVFQLYKKESTKDLTKHAIKMASECWENGIIKDLDQLINLSEIDDQTLVSLLIYIHYYSEINPELYVQRDEDLLTRTLFFLVYVITDTRIDKLKEMYKNNKDNILLSILNQDVVFEDEDQVLHITRRMIQNLQSRLSGFGEEDDLLDLF